VTQLRVLAITAALTASLALCGCITVFPKTKDAQLYRFGETVEARAANPAGPTAAARGLLISTRFTHSAEGDRILTTTGAETAYIAQARWVEPASVLFDEAASRAFEGGGSPFRLMRAGDISSSSARLRISVETFEADYPEAGHGAPTIVVRARVLLEPPAGHGAPVEQVFVSSQPASENRVGPIVAGFEAATHDVLGQIVAFTAAQAGPG
jgi:cholesterol transport system auxiliary component